MYLGGFITLKVLSFYELGIIYQGALGFALFWGHSRSLAEIDQAKRLYSWGFTSPSASAQPGVPLARRASNKQV